MNRSAPSRGGLLAAAVLAAAAWQPARPGEPAHEAPFEPRHFDLLLRGGEIIDGSGEDRYRSDVGIIGDEIAAVGNLTMASAHRIVDVEGRIVAPGFIDLHAHLVDGEYGKKGLLSKDPRRRAAQNYVAQGVTTALGNPDGAQPASLRAQREKLQRMGIGLNLALTNGHNGLRAQVMGDDQKRPANANEIRRMQEIVRHDLEYHGSFGLSLGTEYFSGRYASTTEQVELARVLPAYNGIFIPHMRSQGTAPMWYRPSVYPEIDPPTWHDAVDEVLEVARETGATSVITHMKARGQGYRTQAGRLVAKLQAARDRGDRVYMDVYPYNSSSSDGKLVAIPSWAFGERNGGDEPGQFNYRVGLAATLDDAGAALREDLYRDIRHTVSMRGGPGNILVLSYPDRSYVGRYLSELMALRDLDVVETILTLQREGDPNLPGGARLRALSMAEEDIKLFYSQPWTATSTDGWIVLPEEAVGENKYVDTHRRCFGTFPRRIAHYAVEEGVDTLEQAIRSMTGLPAQILSLSNRGRITVGMKADIAVLNIGNLRDNTTYLEPSVYPDGIDYVLVNGHFVVDRGERTLALPGRVLSPTESRAR